MKITCHACDAKYTIADEKVTGRTVKIKCKKCGATIVVNADPAAAAPAAPAYHDPQQHAAGDDDGLMATRMANEGGGVPGVTAAEWTVSINDQEQQLSSLQIAEEMQRGTVTGDTYVWRDGMGDWMSVAQIPELAALLARAVPGGGHAVAPAHDQSNMGLAGTMVMSDAPAPSPFAAPRPAAGMPGPAAQAPSPAFAAPAAAQGQAARRANRPGGAVDVFQANAETREPDRPRPPTPAGKLGERNENSVLFSLSALTATETAASKGRPDDVIDLGMGGRSNGKGSAVDDLMNLGGGAIGGPMLAPPPLLAPVVEPPPAPVPVAVQATAAMPGAMPSNHPAAMAQQQQFVIPAPPPKSKTPLIVGGALGGALIIGLIAFFAVGGPPPPELTPTSTATAAVTSAPSPTVTASEAPTATEAPASSGSAAPAASSAVVAVNDPAGKNPSTGTGGGPKPKETASSAPTASAKTSADPAPQPTATSAPTSTDTGGGGRDFNKGAATTALSAAASAAKGCKGAVTGSASVRVVFAPSGNVTSANVNGPPFAGTPQGGCIANAFRGAHVPPFDGSPVAVSKTVNIN